MFHVKLFLFASRHISLVITLYQKIDLLFCFFHYKLNLNSFKKKKADLGGGSVHKVFIKFPIALLPHS